MENAKYTIDTNTGELIFDNGINEISRRDISEEEKEKIKSIVIPDSVKEISPFAFYDMGMLEKIILPEGVETIEEKAFFNCTRLAEVVFPKSLKSIGKKAFSGCSSLTHIVLPQTTSWLEIKNEAFADCIHLNNVEIGEGAFSTLYLYEQVFENTAFLDELRKKDPLVILEDEVIDGKECQGDLILPAHVKGISIGAFSFNHKITSVVCPDSMEYINDSAFEGCISLKKVVLSESINYLHGSSFRGCISLEEVLLPKKEIRHIGEDVFKETPWLKKRQTDGLPVILNGWLIDGSACKGEVHISGVKYIARNAFKSNHEITKVTIEEGCEDIYPKAFMDCPALKEVTLPSQMKGLIGFSAFENCYQLSKINIPENMEGLSSDLFYNCLSLKEINIPKSLKKIRRRAFFNCIKLPNIAIDPNVELASDYNNTDKEKAIMGRIVTAEAKKDCRMSYHNGEEECIFIEECKYRSQKDIVVAIIPEGVKVIGKDAFAWCQNLMKVVLPTSLEVIESRAFLRCERLEEIVLPEHLKVIEENAFCCCGKLKSIVIPKGLNRLEESVFDNCDLRHVFLPQSLKEIGRSCFSYCKQLQEISWPSSVPVIHPEMFNECESLRKLEIPEGVTTLEEKIIKECKCLKTVKLPSTIREIGSEAFLEAKITEIFLAEGVETIGTRAFADCEELEFVNYPSSLKKIKAFAFENCKKLKRPKNLKNVSIHRDAYQRSFLTACLTKIQDLNKRFNIVPFVIIMTILSIIFSFFFQPILSAIVLSFVIMVMCALAFYVYIIVGRFAFGD